MTPEPLSEISAASPDRIEVRGSDLTGDLMGRLTFTEFFHLLLTGREPTDDERFFLDVVLVSIAEHGLMPSNVAARMTLAADPGALQGAVAAGILGAGTVILGAAGECATLLLDAEAPRRRGGGARTHRRRAPRAGVRSSSAQARRPPRRTDPRARRRAPRCREVRRAHRRAA